MKPWTIYTHTKYSIYSPDTFTVRNKSTESHFIYMQIDTHQSTTHHYSSAWHACVCVCECVFTHVCEQSSCSAGTQWRCYPVLLLLPLTKTRLREIVALILFSISALAAFQLTKHEGHEEEPIKEAPCSRMFVISWALALGNDGLESWKCPLIRFFLLSQGDKGSLEVTEHFTIIALRSWSSGEEKCYWNTTVMTELHIYNVEIQQWQPWVDRMEQSFSVCCDGCYCRMRKSSARSTSLEIRYLSLSAG